MDQLQSARTQMDRSAVFLSSGVIQGSRRTHTATALVREGLPIERGLASASLWNWIELRTVGTLLNRSTILFKLTQTNEHFTHQFKE